MIGQKYKTRYANVVPKNTTGKCIEVTDGKVHALKLEFSTGECFWFLSRELVEVE